MQHRIVIVETIASLSAEADRALALELARAAGGFAFAAEPLVLRDPAGR